jgi:chorismate mutase/prephenate dehydratase
MESKVDIKKVRDKMDEIDKKIILLIAERFSFLPDVVAYKKENNLPTQDKERERELINKCIERGK